MSSITTIAKPPGAVRNSRGGGQKKFHTLHCGEHIFTIQKNGTSVVAFRNRFDANRFGKLLESHFDLSLTWPSIDFEESLMFRKPKEQALKYLSMRSWREADIRDFCIDNYMNMLDIFRIEDEYRLVGRSISWEAPMDFYIESLNKRLY